MSSGKICENCGKGVMYGHNMSHAKNRTNRIFEPNLHSARVSIKGVLKKAKVCTKCLRRLKKEMISKIPPKVGEVKSPATVSA